MSLRGNDDCVVLVFPGGKLSDDRRRDFGDQLMDLTRGGSCRRIVVDLGKAVWFSSLDLGVFAFALRECRERQVPLLLARASKRVRRVFEATQMDSYFPMFDSVEAAVNHQPAPSSAGTGTPSPPGGGD